MAKSRNYIASADRDSDARVQRFQSSSGYYLLYEASVGAAGSGRKHRIYVDADYALVYTWNARCTDGTTTWAADLTGQPAYRFDIGTSLGRSMITGANTSTPWTDSEWGASGAGTTILGRITMSASGVINLLLRGTATDETLVPDTNALYGDNIVKAWANITIAGGGGTGNWSVTNFYGFNIASVSRLSAYTASVTLSTALSETTSVTPIVNVTSTTTGYIPRPTLNSVSNFRISGVTSAGADFDMDAYSGTVYMYFALLGRQA